MAETDPIDPPTTFADRAAASRGVGDDMAAIFGAERRAEIATPAPFAVRPRRSRLGLAAVVVGGLSAVVGAGLLAGGSVVGLPANAAVDSPASTLRRAVATPPTLAVAGPQIPVSGPALVPVAPPPAPFEPVPVPVPRNVTAVLPSAPVTTSSTLPRPPAEQRAATPAAPPADCDSDGTCIDGQLEAAEREIADAYEEATNAGVRARILRGYRNEWLRARDVAAGRPREALRLYAMMTADLHNLSDDAVPVGRPDWR